MSTLDKSLLRAGTIGAIAFVAIWLFEGAVRPNYDAARLPISALSLGPRGWVQATNFLVCGALMTAFAAGLRTTLYRGQRAPWVAWLFGLFAVALIVSGLFPMDPLDATTATKTGVIHDAAGIVVFLAMPLAIYLAGRRLAQLGFARWRTYSTATALSAVALLVTFSVLLETSSPVAGLAQRVLVVVGWTWIAVFGATTDRTLNRKD